MTDSSAMVSITAADTADTETPKPSSTTDNSSTGGLDPTKSIAAAAATTTTTTTTTTEPNEPVLRDEQSAAALSPKPPTILLPPVEIEDSRERSAAKENKGNKENDDSEARCSSINDYDNCHSKKTIDSNLNGQSDSFDHSCHSCSWISLQNQAVDYHIVCNKHSCQVSSCYPHDFKERNLCFFNSNPLHRHLFFFYFNHCYSFQNYQKSCTSHQHNFNSTEVPFHSSPLQLHSSGSLNQSYHDESGQCARHLCGINVNDDQSKNTFQFDQSIAHVDDTFVCQHIIAWQELCTTHGNAINHTYPHPQNLNHIIHSLNLHSPSHGRNQSQDAELTIHDQTLKLLQEQEERLKRELEELSAISSDQQRKPIPSDTQDVLQEMEELRTQFQNAKEQHEKALEDIAAERALEISQLKESHETLLLAMTQERDTVAESLKTLKESGELSEGEKNDRIKELEQQMETALQGHAGVVAEHAVALENLRDEMESAWNLKLESRIQSLEKEHKELLSAAEERIEKTGHSGEEAIQELKDSFAEQIQELKVSFAEQIKELEDEKESHILELIAQHELELQTEKDRFVQQVDAHEELIAQLKEEHEEVVGKLKIRLESTENALENAQSEMSRVHTDHQEELREVRVAMEEIRKLLTLKETETADLERRVQELTDDLENVSMSAKLKNNKKYKVKLVQIYGSSVSGNLKVKRAQQSISDALEQLEIGYEFVDVSSTEEAKAYMRRKNGGELQLPQVFSGGEYRGLYEDFEYAIETHQLTQFLGFDRVRAFVPQRKANHHSILEASALAQDGEDAEQGAGLPDVVINGLGNRLNTPSTGNISPSSGRKSSDLSTSMYLLSPSSNRFQSTSSLASNSSSRSNGGTKRPGFVQTASQAWDGALKDDITHAKHDLGFNSTVNPDDDELDELFEKGAVSEAELEAMLASVRV
ncbi:hypothetical protein BGX33_011833 [Mortierella sp. NVP41]|nr:hypothetical protein BGX33_011833 [Mortierella sp. NVP41]